MSEKKCKFNLIDAIVVLVLIAALCFAGYKLFIEPNSEQNIAQTTYEVSYFCEEVPTFAAEAMFEGDPVSDEYKDVPLGKVTSVSIAPSTSYVGNAQGDIVTSSREGYNSVKLTTEVTVSGEPYQHGIQIGSSKYGVGHSITLRVGKAKIFGRVSGIEVK